MNPAPLDRAELCELIPHAGAMCLLETVLAWDSETIHCRAQSHRGRAHPLAHDGRLDALHLIEYGAQAMAVHGGLLARAAGSPARPGLLVAVRNVAFEVERIDDIEEALEIHARRLLASIDGAGGWLYEFSASAGTRPLARGRIAVMNSG